ncbi:hypothetical protein D3C80_971610 [compost metagenome]
MSGLLNKLYWQFYKCLHYQLKEAIEYLVDIVRYKVGQSRHPLSVQQYGADFQTCLLRQIGEFFPLNLEWSDQNLP